MTPEPTPETKIDFSIVVAVRNQADEIRRCVASLYAVDYDPTRYEVIVVDNGSTDETARAAAQSGARVVGEPGPNRCNARNLGASLARGRWICFTDADCEADAGLLAGMAAEEARLGDEGGGEKIGAFAGAIEPGEATTAVEGYIAMRGWIDQERFLESGRKFSPPFAATANLAVRANVFREVGGFDPELSVAGEDADWCWRASEAGWAVRYVPGAKIVHHHRATREAMLRQAYNYGIGNADLFAKYRAKWGAKNWIELNRYAWAAKGLIKSPFSLIAGRNELDRRTAWYDFLTNCAQAAGRFRGGRKHGALVL